MTDGPMNSEPTEADHQPQAMPAGFLPQPVPTGIESAIVHDSEGRAWCIAKIIQGNAVIVVMMQPRDMKAFGEAILELGIRGGKAPIVPAGGLIVPR